MHGYIHYVDAGMRGGTYRGTWAEVDDKYLLLGGGAVGAELPVTIVYSRYMTGRAPDGRIGHDLSVS